MISFNLASEQVGYDRKSQPPASIYSYFAYKNGEAKEFDSLADAEKFSKNTERTVKNKDEVNAFWSSQQDQEQKAMEIWYDALREEYSYLNDDLFAICYSEAHERGHSSGYDEVANYMIETSEFAEKILKAAK